MRKYISFAPYYSGLSNIIMSYECAFSIAYITKRTIVLPPNTWCLFISKGHKPQNYVDLWEVFDKKNILSEFDCIDFYDVPEFKGNFVRMDGHSPKYIHNSYTKNIKRTIKNLKYFEFSEKLNSSKLPVTLEESQKLFVAKDYFGDPDFEEFRQNRDVINLSEIEEQVLHFEDNLFGSYWYSIYPGGEDERNKMKSIINKCFRYNDRIYFLASKVFNTIGKYNAIHVRRTDFLQTRKSDLEPISTPEKLKLMVEVFFNKDVPLYVSTDESDKSFFDELAKEYNLFFYEDFKYELTPLDKCVVEQTICSQAELFYGTYLSTYTSRINVMRGLEGRQSEDDMGINYYPYESRQDVVTANPWKLNPGKRWCWSCSYHPQWKTEKNGKYI